MAAHPPRSRNGPAPALSNAPGHDLWRRDFTGASGLFSVVLRPCTDPALDAFLDALRLFGMGVSRGGCESLCIPFRPHRTATRWLPQGPCPRLHVGLENPADLIADLTEGFRQMSRV